MTKLGEDMILSAITNAYIRTDDDVTAIARDKDDRSGCTSVSAIIRTNSLGSIIQLLLLI
jgi:hypothetical protein